MVESEVLNPAKTPVTIDESVKTENKDETRSERLCDLHQFLQKIWKYDHEELKTIFHRSKTTVQQECRMSFQSFSYEGSSVGLISPSAGQAGQRLPLQRSAGRRPTRWRQTGRSSRSRAQRRPRAGGENPKNI